MNLKKEEGINSLVKAGSEITGLALGAAIGAALGGPIGAGAGGASGPLLTRGIIEIGNDIADRFLSDREKIRIGGVIIYAYDKIQKKWAAGEKLRDDGFFEQPSTGHPACAEIPIIERPPAEEVIEGILLAVQREHEEDKLPFIGNLLANIFFDSTIDIEQANLLIELSETITFRQMVLLSVYINRDRLNKIRKNLINDKSSYPNSKRYFLLQEAIDLNSKGLLGTGGYKPAWQETVVVSPIKTWRDLQNSDFIHVTDLGLDLHKLMELEKIGDDKLEAIVSLIFNADSTNYSLQH